MPNDTKDAAESITFNAEKGQKKALKALAKKTDTDVSKILRRWIMRGLKEELGA